MPPKRTTEEFINLSIQKHSNKNYDYSLTNYVNSTVKVTIICPDHGEFTKLPSQHLAGSGCGKCKVNISNKEKSSDCPQKDASSQLNPLLLEILQAAEFSSEDLDLWVAAMGSKKVEVLSLDIDGTVANIDGRVARAKGIHNEGSKRYWEELLRGDLYHMDEPIQESLDSVNAWLAQYSIDDWRKSARLYLKSQTTPGVELPRAPRIVVYVSGRRAGTEPQTIDWLQRHKFPQGRVFHRDRGTRSFQWKVSTLRDLRKVSDVRAHIGDREDDRMAAKQARVMGVHVNENIWLTQQEIKSGGYEDIVLVARKTD